MNFISKQQCKVKQFIKKLVNENKILNSLDRNNLLQLSRPFNTSDRKNSDPSDILIRLKQKIIQICDSQRSQCVDYLMLPKFNILSQKSKKLFRQILQQIWSQFNCKSKQLQTMQKISTLLCKSDSLLEQQNFHLRNFFHIKNSINFQHNHMMPMPNFHQNYQSMMNPNLNMIKHDAYQPYNSNPYNINKKSIQIYPNKKINQNVVPKVQENDLYLKDSLLSQKKNKLQENQSSPFIVTSGKRKTNTVVNSTPNVNGNNKAFYFCVCRGYKGANQRFIQCQKCQKRYHLSCLQIPTHYTIKQNSSQNKKCPYCCVKQSTLFSQVIGDPLDFFWTSQKDLVQKKFIIKSKKCKQIVDKKYGVSFRFLRIQGLQFFEEAQESIQSTQSNNKISDIIINDSIFSKNNGEDVKINFDNAKILRQDANSPAKQNFIAVCQIKPLKRQQVLSKVTQVVEQNFLQLLFKQGQQELKIQIINHHGTNLIQLPCRGLQCNHPGVFDGNQFITHCIQNDYDDSCFICKKRCRGLKIDKVILKEIQKIREQSTEYYPDTIYYKRNSKQFRWGQIRSKNRMQGEQVNYLQGQINFQDQIPNSDNDYDDEDQEDDESMVD